MNQQRKNAKKMATRVAAGTLAATLTFGNVAAVATPVYAAETEASYGDNNLDNVVNDAVNAIASLPYGEGTAEAVDGVLITVAGEDKIIGGLDKAEEIIEEKKLLDSEEVNDATTDMNLAENHLGNLAGTVDGMDDKYTSVEDMELGSSEEAAAVIEKLEAAEQEYANAQTELSEAEAKLAEAQREYDAAKVISDVAAEAAKVKLEVAQTAVAEAEKVAEAANNSVKAAQDLLNKVSDKLTEAEGKVNESLEEAQGKLEESKENLDSALENVETSNTDFNTAIIDFKTKYDAFVESANKLYEAVENAQATEEALEDLYDEYEAAQEALEAAKAAYAEEQAKCEELGYEFGEDYFAEFEKYISDLEDAMNAAEGLKNTAEAEKNTAEANKSVYESEEAKAYEDELNGYRDTLKSEKATQEQKDAAALAAAKLVIEKELAAGQTVKWIPAGDSEYGKSETGFYVVLDAEGKIVERYGYKLESSSVDIYQMKSDEVVNYVTYNGVTYPLTEVNDKLTITVDGKPIVVKSEVKDGNTTYYVEDIAETNEIEDTDRAPEKMTLTPSLVKVLKKIWPAVEDYAVLDIMSDSSTSKLYIELGNSKYYLEGNKNGEYKLDMNKLGKWAVTVYYPIKTQIVYGGGQYDIKTAEDGSKYIVEENGTKVTIYVTEDENGNVTYTTRNNTEYAAGGTADTIFEIGVTTNKNSNTYANAKNDAVNDYNNKFDYYNACVSDYQSKNEAFEKSNEVFQNLVEVHESLNNAQTAADEKDLGAMAELPKNISEMVEGLGAEQTEALLKTVVELTTSEENIDYEVALKVLAEVVDADAAAKLIAVMIYDEAANAGVPDWLLGLGGETPSDFEREYANAWVDALEAKINVVNAAVDVVEATKETIDAGIRVINEGKELGDSAVDTLLVQIEEAILNGTVETLLAAADVLDVTDRIVDALASKIGQLQAETDAAYKAVVAAKENLEAIKVTNPKAEELEAAKNALKDAKDRYNELSKALEGAQEDLETAKAYKEEAQKQYAELSKPAEGDTEELPTPGVETPEVPSEPVDPENGDDNTGNEGGNDKEESTIPTTPVTPSNPGTGSGSGSTGGFGGGAAGGSSSSGTTTEESTTIEDEETPLAAGYNMIETAKKVKGTEKDGKFYDEAGNLIVSARIKTDAGKIVIVDAEGELVRMGFTMAEDTYALYFTDENGVVVTKSFIIENGDSYIIVPKSEAEAKDLKVKKTTIYFAGKKGKIATDRNVKADGYKFKCDEEGVIVKKSKIK